DWRALNVNKRSLNIDLKQAADAHQLDALLGNADVCFLTPASSAAGGGLQPEALRDRYPRLVLVVITPFGRFGPRRDWRASDLEVMAAGGAMALAGEPEGVPLRVSEPQSYGWAAS